MADLEPVLVALSGGMDSAATVLMLRERGFRVTALYMDMFGAQAERERAILTARSLDVELLIEDVSEMFRNEIIHYVLREHQAGRTPAPCSRCNPRIKWNILLAVADRMGIVKVATGHYVRIIKSDGAYWVGRGADPTKDQSYYLWALTPKVLERALTPLGDYTKHEIRAYLSQHGYRAIAGSAESMGVCFLAGTGYADFLAENMELYSGDVVDKEGRVVGRHRGYQLYTVGQKRGFESSVRSGAVMTVDARGNRLIVTDCAEDLYVGQFFLEQWVVSDLDELLSRDDISVMVRGIGRNPQGCCSVSRYDDRLLRVDLRDDRAWALAAGQPAVLYIGERVVAGGIITL